MKRGTEGLQVNISFIMRRDKRSQLAKGRNAQKKMHKYLLPSREYTISDEK